MSKIRPEGQSGAKGEAKAPGVRANAAAETPECVPVFVARQPIYDRKQAVWGYELFFRHSSQAQEAQISDHDAATAYMATDGVAIALEGIRNGQKLLVNCSSSFVLKKLVYALPAERCLVDLVVRQGDPALTEACCKLAEAGYGISLDLPAPSSLIKIASIVKLDVSRIAIADIEKLVAHLRPFSCTLLGEKIETEEAYKQLLALGVQLFQGYYFCRPVMLPGRKLSTTTTSKLKLIGELSQADFDLTRVNEIIMHDPVLSYRLLSFINSAYFSQRGKITSVQKAILLLGHLPLKYWLMAVLLAEKGLEPRVSELYFTSVQRGRFLELLSQKSLLLKSQKEPLMLLGLFSQLDAMLGQPMAAIVEAMALDPEVKAALRREDVPGRQWIELVEGIEHGRWQAAHQILVAHGLKTSDAAICYNNASLWTTEFLASVDIAA